MSNFHQGNKKGSKNAMHEKGRAIFFYLVSRKFLYDEVC